MRRFAQVRGRMAGPVSLMISAPGLRVPIPNRKQVEKK